jgi:hypothetical protein
MPPRDRVPANRARKKAGRTGEDSRLSDVHEHGSDQVHHDSDNPSVHPSAGLCKFAQLHRTREELWEAAVLDFAESGAVDLPVRESAGGLEAP